jgi:SAM-dependent methyltransferase
MDYILGPDGIHRAARPVQHRDEDFPEIGIDVLCAMEERHFWYRGRHRFLLAALDRMQPAGSPPWSAVDLGGGIGRWAGYLVNQRPTRFSPLALADSSETALRMAGETLPTRVARYQVDLMDIGWEAQWDCAFLLDVIEHLPDDVQAMRQAAWGLKPRGLLFVTTPALKQFWSSNDEFMHHLRRYTRKDYAALAQASGLELLDARYFMFLLSPLYWLARKFPSARDISAEQKRQLIQDSYRVPSTPLNLALTAVFAAETPLGHWLRFPWGTSILGVFRKP